MSDRKCGATDINGTRHHLRKDHVCILPPGHRNHLHVCYCSWTWE